MNIIINGNSRTADFKNVRELLEKEDLNPDRVVVELNSKILPRDQYETPLKDGDVIEIVQFVAGG